MSYKLLSTSKDRDDLFFGFDQRTGHCENELTNNKSAGIRGEIQGRNVSLTFLVC